ncbi:peripherin-2-like [Aphis craccivora]|uniref:Peripherin-2-like n=1 Tax=Aphis craccivora TaxID=307492 RepID=A0A6G0YUT1_APHCR|nr:peripherin-2-like [Aphis craccivora]
MDWWTTILDLSQWKIALTKQSLKLRSYVVATAVEAMVLISYCANLQFTLQTISGEIENILTSSLNKYSTNRAWQLFWDQFQQHYYCCGSSKNTDWFQTAWVSPINLSSFSLLKKYTQQNGKFIIPAAPISCCLPDSICDTFTDGERPDPQKYFQNSCSSIIANKINSIASTRYLFYAVLVIQIISAVVKYEGYTDNDQNPTSKL